MTFASRSRIGWYRRAYFDDGTPLGSAQNDECQIDALPQARAVISGAADPERARQALAAVEQRLVRPDGKLVQLFDPPFDGGGSNRVTSRATCQASARTAASTRTPPPGSCLATALQGRGDGALELWNLINPIHALTPADVQHYKVEPYVVCADVYGAPPHTGRGGWTWYTGSASWLYRVALETILASAWLATAPLRAVRPIELAGVRDHLPLPVRDVPRPGGEPNQHRPGRPIRHGGRSAGAGRDGTAAGRRANARRQGDARLTQVG